MNDLRTHEHDWALDQLTAFSAGMLPEEQTLRLEEHLHDCEDCRSRLAPVRATSADLGHLPASLIATWPRTTRLLSGMERDLVESHLRSCDACRATLAFAGHEPVLSAKVVALPARAVRAPAKRNAWGWALGLSGLAATAAAWLLVVRPAMFPLATSTSGSMGSAGHPAQSVGFEFAVPADGSDAVTLPDAAPGSAVGGVGADVAISAGPSGWLVRLPVSLRPLTHADRDRLVSLQLLGGTHEFARGNCRWVELGAALRIRPERALPEGDYELRLSIAAADAAAPAQVWRWALHVK